MQYCKDGVEFNLRTDLYFCDSFSYYDWCVYNAYEQYHWGIDGCYEAYYWCNYWYYGD
ncbi:MAG: hypothetical protein OHK0038_27740 [Flammeovirgaceae bacterium]